jgi:hypothetical protein
MKFPEGAITFDGRLRGLALHALGRLLEIPLGGRGSLDRIPGSAPSRDLLHAHRWKQGLQETEATTQEMRRKARQIAPAYNKGALQYLPGARKTSGPQEVNK